MRRPKRKRKATLLEFRRAFPDEPSCAHYLFKRRWPDGFICPNCGAERRAAALKRRAWTYECLKCGRQTSLTAGTAMHRTKQPLTAWFWAAHLMATHSNGISALQLKDQLGLSYKVAWLLVQKLRRAMVDPDREKLEGLIEIDQTEIPYRTGDAFFDPTKAGKIIIVGAVEVVDHTTGDTPAIKLGKKYLDTRSGRIRLAAIPSNDDECLREFIVANVARGSSLLTDGHASYTKLDGYEHDPRVVGLMAAHIVLPWIHRVFSLLKRWALGTYHGLRRKHVDSDLNEFVFRYNRRFYRHVSFETFLGLAAHGEPTDYWKIVGRPNPRKGRKIRRLKPRRRRTPDGLRQDPAPKPKKIAGPSTKKAVEISRTTSRSSGA